MMKNIKLARIIAWNFLLFAVYSLLFVNFIVSSVQGQSTQLKLERTKWRGAATIFLGSGEIDTRYFEYTFGEKEKVKVQYNRELTGSRTENSWNNSTQSYESRTVNTVISNSLFAEVGTYKQNGNSISLNFGDHTIDATIESERMKGMITLKISGEKAKWGATKNSNDSQQVNSNTSRQSNIVIPNKSTVLPMEERLPEKIGQFKRGKVDFTTYILDDGVTTSGDIDNYIKGIVKSNKGKVEGVGAYYGEVYISLTRFKDSTKSAAYLEDIITKSSASIVKKEPVKNRSGQIVGELAVWQAKSDNLNIEVVKFTDGLYLYSIESKVFGEAQKLQKLLPLE